MLTKLLIRIFVKDSHLPEKPEVRLRYGVLSGSTGIVVNLILCSIKFTVGLIAGSIAMMTDALNNLSDAGSCLVTVFGFRMSAKSPDKEHPFGHGRIEYVAGLIVAVLIIAVGLDFLKESVMRIISPSKVDADPIVLGIFGATMLFKVWLFFFYRKVAFTIKSPTIHAAAFDSLSDLLATSVVLLAVMAARFTSFPVDGCAGTVVAILIVAGGIKVLRDTMNPLLGECPDKELVEELRQRLLGCRGIKGVHDIIIHNYGPNRYFATAHAEVDQEGDLMSVHDKLEEAEVEISKHMPIRLILHCDPYNTSDPLVKLWRSRMEEAVTQFDRNFKMYDFRLEDTEKPLLHFHLLIPRDYMFPHEKITYALTEHVKTHSAGIALKIDFVHSYV